MNSLPTNDESIKETAKNIKKFGFLKFIGLQILRYLPVVVISVITAGITASKTVENKLEVNTNINLNQNRDGVSIQLSETAKESNEGEQLKSFDQNNWELSQARPKITDDGYFCPKNVAFPAWFLRTKRKFLIGKDITIVFRLKDRTKDNKPPALLLAYGDKTGSKPEIFYQINILDGDLKTIRLYDKNQQPLTFDRAEHEPDLQNEMVIKIKSYFPKSSLVKIILNPELSFNLEGGKSYTFEPNPEKEFSVTEIPLAGIDQQGEGKSYGIGVSKGDCFKIISSNLE